MAGLLASLMIWVGAYTLASESDNASLNALAPYLEAMSSVGQALFVRLAAIIALVC